MVEPTYPISSLLRRIIDDMRMRQLFPKTQHNYLRAVRQFAGFLGRSPGTRRPPRICAAINCTWSTAAPRSMSLNAAISALEFFFAITADLGLG